MASGRINVGSAEVTIVPDLRGFATSVAAGVSPQAAALGQQLGKLIGDRIAQQMQDGINRGLNGSQTTARAQGSRQGADYAGSFADSFRARLTAAMRSLPEIQLKADSSDTDVKVASIRAQLDELSQKRINVDISETEALEKLSLLQARLDELATGATSIQLKVDATRAKEELEAFAAEVRAVGAEKATVDVDVDTGGAEEDLAGLDSAAGAASGGFSGLIAAGIALAPALIPVIAAVTAAVVALLSVLGAGVIGVGVLALGFSGVIKGVQALDQEQKKSASSGRSAASSALAQAGAADQLKSAEEALANTRANAASSAVRAAEAVKTAKQDEADAEQNAAQSITAALKKVTDARAAEATAAKTAAANNRAAEKDLADAEKQVTTAQQNATDAQKALTDARETAKEQAEDLANSVVDGQLAQQQAVLDLADAQDQLNQANDSPISSQAQKDQAEITFQQANQHLNELTLQNQRLADQKAQSDADGVEGSQVVVSAQNAVVQANQAVVDAQDKVTASAATMIDTQKAGAAAVLDAQRAILVATTGVHQAQTDGAKTVTKAEQGVTDAIRAQADQQRQSAFSITQALAAVAAAHRAIGSAALGGAAGIAKQKDAYDKLDPIEKAFVQFIVKDLEPAFSGIQKAAADGLLPGVEAGLKLLLPLFKSLTPFVSDVAKAMGDLFFQGSKALTNPFWTQFISFAETNAIPVLHGLAQFLGDIVTGLAGLIEGFAPTTASIGGAILDLGADFAQFGVSAGQGTNSGFNAFLAYAQQALPVVGGFIEDLVGVVSDVIQVFAPWGLLLLGLIDQVAKLIIAIGPTGLALVLLAVGAAIVAIVDPGLLLVAGFVAIAGGADYLYTHVKSVHDFVDQYLLPIFHGLSDYFTTTVLPVLKQVANDALKGIEGAIADVSQTITDNRPQLETLYNVFKDVVDFIVQHVVPILGPLLEGTFTQAGLYISTFITVVSGIVDIFEAISAAVQGNWQDVLHYITEGIHSVIGLINTFIGALDKIPGVSISAIANIPVTPLSSPGNGTTSGNGSGVGPRHALAWGGVLPGYAPGVDSIPAILSPGEGVLVPEAVRLLGASFVYDINRYASGGRAAGGAGHYAGGGVVSSIGHGIGSAVGGAVHGVESIGAAAVNSAIGLAEDQAHNLVHAALPPGLFRAMGDGVVDLIGNKFKFADGGIVGGSGLSALLGGGQAPLYGTTAGGDVNSATYHLEMHNHATTVSPSTIVMGLNQMHAMHGAPALVGV